MLHLPNYAVTAFGERLGRHAVEPGFTAVLAYADGHPVGYAYGNTIERGDRYWQRTSPAPAEAYTERPAAALKEVGVRPSWRKTGTARRVHDGLLATRDEPYVTLMVNPAAVDGKVHALYASWGYEDIGQSQPSPDSPVLKVMLRAVRPHADLTKGAARCTPGTGPPTGSVSTSPTPSRGRRLHAPARYGRPRPHAIRGFSGSVGLAPRPAAPRGSAGARSGLPVPGPARAASGWAAA